MNLSSKFTGLKRITTHARHFFQRHTHLLSLIGLFLVFVTFVAKEGIRDHAEFIRAWKVGSDVGNVKNDRPDLAEPVAETQSGSGLLF
jgi:hypothetical protein